MSFHHLSLSRTFPVIFIILMLLTGCMYKVDVRISPELKHDLSKVTVICIYSDDQSGEKAGTDFFMKAFGRKVGEKLASKGYVIHYYKDPKADIKITGTYIVKRTTAMYAPRGFEKFPNAGTSYNVPYATISYSVRFQNVSFDHSSLICHNSKSRYPEFVRSFGDNDDGLSLFWDEHSEGNVMGNFINALGRKRDVNPFCYADTTDPDYEIIKLNQKCPVADSLPKRYDRRYTSPFRYGSEIKSFTVQILINRNGKVIAIKSMDPEQMPDIDEIFLSSGVREWQYEPAQLSDKTKVPCWITEEITQERATKDENKQRNFFNTEFSPMSR